MSNPIVRELLFMNNDADKTVTDYSLFSMIDIFEIFYDRIF